MGHTPQKTDDNSLKLLTYMCEDYTSLTTRVARTSIKNSQFPNCVEAIILLFEYIQLMTQALVLTPANNNDFSDEETFFRGIIYIAKMFNPGYYVSFEGKSTLPTLLLFVILGFMILRYLLLGYILAVAYWNIPTFNFLQRIWGFIYKIQARILCCLLTTFWLNAIVASRGAGLSFLGLGETQIVILSIFMIVIEYVFSFALVSRLCYILPTKSFLSAKSNTIESFTLFQKFVIQILEIIFTANKSTDYASSSNVYAFVCINLLLSIGRDAQYYSTLPLYNMKALKFQSFLLQIATSLNLAALFQAIAKSAGDGEPDTEFIVVVWVILSILSVTVTSSLIESFTLDVASSKLKYTSPELLVHKVVILKRLRKTWHGLNENSDRTEWQYFLNKSVNVHAKTILNISSEFPAEIPIDINSKEAARKMFCHYLENISAKYPKDKFIKLYLAYFYAKKLRQYGSAIKIINELQQSSSFKVILSASVLTFEIQNLIKQQYQSSDLGMNIYTYIKSQSELADIKHKMMQQANLQVKLYNGIMEETPTLNKIFENAQAITEYQRNMGKKINVLINHLPDSYIDPILLFGEYYLLLNHSMTDYVSFSKIYAKKYERYAKHFKSDELIQENFYQDSNAFLILSGQKGDAGKIVYCSKSSQYILGGDPRLYLGTNISVTSPPSLQGYYGNQFKRMTEGSSKALFNQVTRKYVYHKDGYMVQVDSFLSIHPFLAHGFYYTLVLRPVPSHKDYMLVHENGDIECATKKISEKLGLHRSSNASQGEKKNVRSISEELGKANEAFNKIEKCSKKTSEEGMEEEEEKTPEKRPERNSVPRNNLLHSNRPGTDFKKQSQVDYRLTMEQAQEIHEKSQSTGLEVSARGYKRGADGKFGGPSAGQRTWYFNCTISTEVYGDLKMKLFTFQDSLQDQKMEEEEVIVLDEEELHSKSNNMDIDELEYKFSEVKEAPTQVDNSAFFRSEDEKAEGWIDFHFLKSEEGLQTHLNTHPEPLYQHDRGDYHATTTYQDNNVLTTYEGGLLSPLRSPLASPLASPGNQPLIKRNETKGKTILLPAGMSKSTASAVDESPNAKLNGVKTTEKPPIMAADASITGSQWSKTSQQRKISHAFKRALAVKYYPKSSLPICLGFYAVLIVVFATQVALKTTIDSTVTDLTNKKEILSQAQLSNYYLVQVGGLYRLISASESGRLTPAELGIFGFLAQILVAYGYTILEGLSTSNQNLMKSTNSLTSDSSREFIFQSNVRVFDNYFGVGDQTYINLTNFEATNRIIEHGLMVNGLQSTNVTASLEGFPFLYRNALNDLLVKNEKISYLFADSLEAQREELFTIANRYLIVTIAVVTCLFIGFLYLTWSQYNQEKANLFAVVKLNTKKIQDLLGSIHAFLKIIETEKSFEKLYADGFSISKFSKKDSKVGQNFGLRREHNKMPIYTGTSAKYMVYAGTLVIFVVVVIGLVVWNTVSDKNSASFFKTKQNQVFFADHLKSRSYLAQITSMELLNTNGLNTVENVAVAEKLPLCIGEVNSMRVEASTIFMNEDTSYDPDIKEVLFYEGCSPASLRTGSGTFCTVLENQGYKMGLIYLLSSLEDILTTRLQKYEDSDKSYAALRDIEAADYQTLTSLILVATAQAEFISSKIESGFEDELAQAKKTRTTVIVIFTIGLVILSVLMWFLFLKKLREANNKFKNVLRTLPAGLVLSSFILKTFLIKSSRGALDSVKNDI